MQWRAWETGKFGAQRPRGGRLAGRGNFFGEEVVSGGCGLSASRDMQEWGCRKPQKENLLAYPRRTLNWLRCVHWHSIAPDTRRAERLRVGEISQTPAIIGLSRLRERAPAKLFVKERRACRGSRPIQEFG
jgi:hypothetical protein